jgi:hypothetical protein
MKVSFTGPRMGADVSVYLTDPAFGGERAFGLGSDLDDAGLSPANKRILAGLVSDGLAVQVKAPAKKGDE